MPVIPQYETIDLQLLINGSNENSHTGIKSVKVEYDVNKIPFARVNLVSDQNQRRNNMDNEINYSANDDIEIKIKEDDDFKTLFKGIITEIRKTIRPSGFRIELECRDEVSKLLSVQDMTEDENFQSAYDRLLNHQSISSTIDLGAIAEEKISIIDNLMPWDFIVGNLDAVGFLTTIKNGEFTAVRLNGSEDVVTELQLGLDIFELEYRQSSVVSSVSVEYWSISDQEYKSEEAETEVENSEGAEINDLGHSYFSQETISEIAKARANKNRLSAFSGRVLTFGNLQASYGEYLSIIESGTDFEGKSFMITSEHHTIDENGWKTEYGFGLENNESYAGSISTINHKNESRLGQINAISGLQIGVVTDLESDPDNQFRIQVNIPSIVENQPGIWARMASLQAGNERGAWFIPEIGDEVVLGFFNNQPDAPVVLGKLYSDTNAAPFELSNDNFTQGIVTKEGIKLIFDDDKKAMVFETPGGNSITISDDESGIILKDQNGNKIQMDGSGITMESAKDLNLIGSANANVEGAQTSLKASGVMTVEGSLIQLN